MQLLLMRDSDRALAAPALMKFHWRLKHTHTFSHLHVTRFKLLDDMLGFFSIEKGTLHHLIRTQVSVIERMTSHPDYHSYKVHLSVLLLVSCAVVLVFRR